MAKAKPRTSTTRAPARAPKPRLHTWAVNIDGGITNVEAETFEPIAGGIWFMIGDHITRAVANGHWVTVELLPDQPQD